MKIFCGIQFDIFVIFLLPGYGDLAFDLKTYVWGFTSVLFQGVYLVFVQYSAQSLSVIDTLHINSINTLPILLLLSFSAALQDTFAAMNNFDYTNSAFVVTFSLVICMGCSLNYLLILCTSCNSALTTSITSTLKSILQTVIGMFTFGGISLNVYTISGIIINLTGAVLYSLAKYWEHQEMRKPILKS